MFREALLVWPDDYPDYYKEDSVSNLFRSLASVIAMTVGLSALAQDSGSRAGRGVRRELPAEDRPSRPAPPPPRPPGRDVDRDGVPDRLEHTERYGIVSFSIDSGFGDPVACLDPIGNWSSSERRGWSFRNSVGGDIEFAVTPDCSNFRRCEFSDYNEPPRPNECGDTSVSVEGSQRTLSLQSGRSTTASFQSRDIETEKVCSLERLSPTICRMTDRRRLFTANGFADIDHVDRDGNVLRSERRQFTRALWGNDLDRVEPLRWGISNSSRTIGTSTTDVTVQVLPIDFPKPYGFTATVDQVRGSQARFSFNSKYFLHTVRAVSDSPKSQVFEVSSSLQPIAAENVIVDFDPTSYTLTITDTSMDELSELDPKNSATYTVGVYANWRRVGGDEKLGSILLQRNNQTQKLEKAFEVVTNFNNQRQIAISLQNQFLSHEKFKKEKFDQGKKDWEAYIEVSTTRKNKYVNESSSPMSVTKFVIAKQRQLVPSKTERNFTKLKNYRPEMR